MASASATLVAAVPAPSGYVVDFAHPQRKADIAGYWVFAAGLILSFSFLAMRVYTKTVVTRNFFIEDGCLILAWVFGIATQALLVYLWKHEAIGVHAWEIPLARYNEYNVLIMSASVIYVPCLALAKFSLLLFYGRLTPLRWFKVAVYFLMFVVLGYSFAIIFALIFPCHPIAKNWDVKITTGMCINRASIYTATAAVNIATDVTMLTLPIPVLAKLQMPLIQKIGVAFIFAVGSMTCITSIIRLCVILPMLVSLDQTWAVSIPCVWIVVEANLVIICGSLPVLRHFVRHVAPKLMGESTNASTHKNTPINFTLQTFGSKPTRPIKKRGYHDMKDMKDTVLDEEADIDLDNRCSENKGEVTVGGSGESDGGSETHIVQTKTTTVKYESRGAGFGMKF